MKILLDENVPHGLRHHLRHETATAVYMAFGGYKNGAMLDAAESGGFDVLVTGDRTLECEQNLSGRKIAVVSLSANSWQIIKNHVAKIAAAVDAARPGEVTRVACGQFLRQRKPEGPGLA